MAVFRVEKSRNYTVMSNYHLRDRKLSLKAKGLLSQMLSLPEDWDYTLKGLAQINRESVDAIRTAVWELEAAGYIRRTQNRDEKGKMGGMIYTIYEKPQPAPGKTETEIPESGNPTPEKPVPGDPAQRKKEESKTEEQKKDSLPFPSVSPPAEEREAPEEKSGREGAMEAYREVIRETIAYDLLIQEEPMEKELLDEIVELMVETVSSTRKQIRIAGDDYPADLVRAKLLKCGSEHIRLVIRGLKENTTRVRNIKQYLLASLFNAPSTMHGYYMTRVNHDLYGSPGTT